MRGRVAPGAIFLLNSPHGPDGTWDALPREVQQGILDLGLHLHVVDAVQVAREAGLGGRVHLKSKGDFIGRAALERAKAAPPARRLSTFTVDDRIAVFGGESILHGGEVVSLVTSAGYGHTIGKTILMGYLPAEVAAQEAFEIEAFCVRHAARRVDGPLYDPDGARLKS